MRKLDWKATIEINMFLLKLAGLWPKDDEGYKLNFYALYAIFVINFVMNCPVLLQTINIFFVYPDLEALSATIFITVSELLTIVKVTYFVLNIRTLKQLLITLDSDRFQPKTKKQRIFVQFGLNAFWKMTYGVFWLPASITLFLWTIFPILDKTVKEHRLPLSAWYPYDSKISPFYEITYLHQVASFCFVGTTTLNIDSLITALMMYVGAQCDILCDDLRNLDKDVSNDFNKKLIDCIKHHKEILSFAENCSKFYNMIVMGQFFTSGACIALTLFHLTLIETFSSEFYSTIFYASAAIFELFLYCWFGNEVEVKSAKIPYAAFQSNWIDKPSKAKKTLNIFVMRSQKPITVSAFNVFYLSMDTFVRVLRTSWSYFAVLREINTPE